MVFTVKDKAEYLGTLRWVEVHLMETIASWVPTTAEMEIKVLFGRHVWELAQNADALGKRTFELRAPLHYSIAPGSALREALEAARQVSSTEERIVLFYDVILPYVRERYEQYLKRTDELQDEPTARIIERALTGHERMQRERKSHCEEVAVLKGSASPDRASAWRSKFSGDFVVPGHGQTLARTVPA